MTAPIDVRTGIGYGPVTIRLTADDDGQITADSLRHDIRPDGTLAFYAWCPAAGHPLDELVTGQIHDRFTDADLDAYLGEQYQRTWATTVGFLVADLTDPDTEQQILQLVAEITTTLHAGDQLTLNDDQWAAAERDAAFEQVARHAAACDVEEGRVWDRIVAGPVPWYTDASGVHIPDLDEAIAAERAATGQPQLPDWVLG